MSVHPNDPLMIVDLTEDASLVSIPVRKGEETDSFEEAVNQAIEELRADGTLAQLSVTYFGEDITSEADAEEAQTEAYNLMAKLTNPPKRYEEAYRDMKRNGREGQLLCRFLF